MGKHVGSTQQEWLTTEHAVHDNSMLHLYEVMNSLHFLNEAC
jgi:hypothetical protein